MESSIPFIPGQAHPTSEPLGRYLPPLPEGMVSTWLEEHLPEGSWVLEPFGASPQIALEAARAGYRILVTSNNPIARFLLECSAQPASEADLIAALADLGGSFKGNERIEPHIRSLYLTECATCKYPVEADYFLWERGASGPYARSYRCPHCGDSGEYPATPGDQSQAAKFANVGLHRARALERVAGLDDPDRAHVEEALNAYLPRAVYALFTLINKLDSAALAPDQRDRLRALLLYACDQANTLWPYPTERERPRQLTVPPRFRENNVWQALEQGVQIWKDISGPIPIVHWPNQPPEKGGICLFEGRLKDLAGLDHSIEISAVVTALPRPNQAYWTLSALWAGWLWGKEAVGPFKSVLHRRRYDWAWHTTALEATFTNLGHIIPPETTIWAIAGEAEPGLIGASLLAGEEAGLELVDICMRDDTRLGQITWKCGVGHPISAVPDERIKRTALQALTGYLNERGQPASYAKAHSAVMAQLAWQHCLPVNVMTEEASEPSPAHDFSHLQTIFKDVFSYKNGLLRYDGSEQSLEVGTWWLRKVEAKSSLNDRLETALVRYLQKNPGCTLENLDRAMCAAFPGLHTPNFQFLQNCLDSYAEQDPPDSGRWRLRSQDSPAARRGDMEAVRGLVEQLGKKLGFQCSGPVNSENAETLRPAHRPILWLDVFGRLSYRIYVLASANIGEVVLNAGSAMQADTAIPSGPRSWIIIPGSRANLVAYKINKNPYLKQETTKGWRIVKYRVIRQLSENPVVTPETLEEQLELDPLSYVEPQLRLF